MPTLPNSVVHAGYSFRGPTPTSAVPSKSCLRSWFDVHRPCRPVQIASPLSGLLAQPLSTPDDGTGRDRSGSPSPSVPVRARADESAEELLERLRAQHKPVQLAEQDAQTDARQARPVVTHARVDEHSVRSELNMWRLQRKVEQ